MLDRFLAMKPADFNYNVVMLVMVVGLAIGIGLQYLVASAARRAGDSWYERLERWLR